MPTTLSIITTSFPPGGARPKAVGVWVGVAGGGAVIGLLGSGILLEFFDWSSFFALNVTLAVLATGRDARVRPDLPRSPPAAARLRSARCSRSSASRRSCTGSSRGPTTAGPRHPCSPASPGASPRSRCSSCGSCARPSRCSTRACSGCAASATGSASITVQFFAAFGFFYIGAAVPAVRRRALAAEGRAVHAADARRDDPAGASRAARSPTASASTASARSG